MNLKYYLKGLGLGIIATALILGIHHRGNAKPMTDAEIKARAVELGMVDGGSKLVDNDDVTAEELLEDISQNQEPEEVVEEQDASEDEIATETADESTVAQDDEELPEEQEEEKEIELENTRIDSVTDADDDPDRKNNIEETVEEEPETEEPEEDEKPAQTEESDDNSDSTSVTQVTGGTILTISSGDSSEKVAKKLADLGLVLNASEYDTFLCSYGYDRLIRVGTYTIPDGASNDEIARIITGKQ